MSSKQVFYFDADAKRCGCGSLNIKGIHNLGDPQRWGTNILYLLQLPHFSFCLPANQLPFGSPGDSCLGHQTAQRNCALQGVGINWCDQGHLQTQIQVSLDLITTLHCPFCWGVFGFIFLLEFCMRNGTSYSGEQGCRFTLIKLK